MKIFITWSGEVSHRVALALYDWLPLVIQAAEPYVSSEDIRSGVRWNHELSGRLEEFSTGIACLTPDNLDARWINFEAGALSKFVSSSQMMCLLIGLHVIDVQGPLSQFQATPYTENAVLKMLLDLNEAGSEPRASKEAIRHAFNKNWPDLQEKLDPLVEEAISSPEGKKLEHVDVAAVLGEILAMVRSQQNILYNRLPPNDPISVRIARETSRAIAVNWITVEKFIQSTGSQTIPEDVRNASAHISNLILELIADEATNLFPGIDLVDIAKWKEHALPFSEWMTPEPLRLRRIVVTDSSQEQTSEGTEVKD